MSDYHNAQQGWEAIKVGTQGSMDMTWHNFPISRIDGQPTKILINIRNRKDHEGQADEEVSLPRGKSLLD